MQTQKAASSELHFAQSQQQVNRFTKLMLNYAAQFCYINLNQDEQFYVLRKTRPELKRMKSQREFPFWSKVCRVLYVFSSLMLIANCFQQYVYDIDLYKYRSFLSDFPTAVNDSTRASKLLELWQSVEESRKVLRLIGSPHLNFNFMAECNYLYVLGFSFLSYAQTQIYYSFVRPFNFSLIRMLMDSSSETDNYKRLIVDESERFIESSRNLVRSYQLENDFTTQLATEFSLIRACSQSTLSKLLRDHQNTVEQLRSMIDSGALLPFNRQPNWMRTLSNWYAAFGVCFLVLCFPLIAYIWVIPLHVFPDIPMPTEPLDILIILGLLLLDVFGIVGCGFYLSVIVFDCIDQVYLIGKLNKQIKSCTNCNRLRLLQFHCNHQAQSNWKLGLRSQMNMQLLQVFLHHKLFMRQLGNLLHSHGFLTLVALEALLFPQLVLCINAPFVDAQFRTLVMILALVPVLWVNCSLVLICYMHSRCLELHKSLEYLLAHLVESEERSELVYADHTVVMLRKELRESDQVELQLAPKVLGMPFNYPMLLRAYFWCGILLLSVLISSGQNKPGHSTVTFGFF